MRSASTRSQAMEQGRAVFVALWRSLPGTLLLYRRAVRPRRARAAQAVSPAQPQDAGLGARPDRARPPDPVLARGPRHRHLRHSICASASRTTTSTCSTCCGPDGAWRQSLMLLIVWLHGCIGLHFWLRLRPWYRRAAAAGFSRLALLLPTLSLIGFANGGREVRARAAADPAWLAAQAAAGDWPDPAERAWVYRDRAAGCCSASAWCCWRRPSAAGCARCASALRRPDPPALSGRRQGRDRARHERARGEPRGRHAACLGVRRARPLLDLPGAGRRRRRAPAAAGRRRGPGAGPDRRHRRQRAPRLPAAADATISRSCRCCRRAPARATVRVQVNPGQGIEREIAVLFADLRAFTRMAEGRLPYDVVFVLNQYFKAMGQAIESAGGRVDKFIGDGIMALFGIDREPEAACRAGARRRRARWRWRSTSSTGELDARSARAAPHRHRPARRAGDPRRDGLPARDLADRDRRYGQRRLAARGADQGARRPAGGLGARSPSAPASTSARFELREIEIRGRRRPLRVRLVADAAQPAGRRAGRAPAAAPWARLIRSRPARAAAGAVSHVASWRRFSHGTAQPCDRCACRPLRWSPA